MTLLLVTLYMAAMHAFEPATLPWEDTLPDTAEAFAQAADVDPLGGISGHPNVPLTAAILVVMGWQETRFDPNAIGDGGGSMGILQVSPQTAGLDDRTAGDLLLPDRAAGIALEVIHQSFSICRKQPLERRLSWYAAGGSGCERRWELSEYRMRMAERLVREHPLNLVAANL